MTETTGTREILTFEIGDRVSEVYYGQMGEEAARKLRQRMHWVTGQVTGRSVLDVGCSQGIGCVLLGREGHQVLGVDRDPHAITKARAYLEQEPQSVRDNVTFLCEDFLGAEFEDQRFSAVVFGGVLEHLIGPAAFLERAWQLLEDKGQIIVTVPFGVNDFPDHKQTFYLTGVLGLLQPYFEVTKIEYLGRWIGFVGTRRSDPSELPIESLSLEQVKALEDAFHPIERDLVDHVIARTTEATRLNQQVGELQRSERKLTYDLAQSQKLNVNQKAKYEDLLERTKEIGYQRAAQLRDQKELNKQVNARFASVKQECDALRKQAERYKKSATYEIGSSFVLAGKSVSGALKLPFRLVRVVGRRLLRR